MLSALLRPTRHNSLHVNAENLGCIACNLPMPSLPKPHPVEPERVHVLTCKHCDLVHFANFTETAGILAYRTVRLTPVGFVLAMPAAGFYERAHKALGNL